MIARDGTLVLIMVMILAAALGLIAATISKEEDGAIEELSENIIEDAVEHVLRLPKDTVNIDLTPKSPEHQK